MSKSIAAWVWVFGVPGRNLGVHDPVSEANPPLYPLFLFYLHVFPQEFHLIPWYWLSTGGGLKVWKWNLEFHYWTSKWRWEQAAGNMFGNWGERSGWEINKWRSPQHADGILSLWTGWNHRWNEWERRQGASFGSWGTSTPGGQGKEKDPVEGTEEAQPRDDGRMWGPREKVL